MPPSTPGPIIAPSATGRMRGTEVHDTHISPQKPGGVSVSCSISPLPSLSSSAVFSLVASYASHNARVPLFILRQYSVPSSPAQEAMTSALLLSGDPSMVYDSPTSPGVCSVYLSLSLPLVSPMIQPQNTLGYWVRKGPFRVRHKYSHRVLCFTTSRSCLSPTHRYPLLGTSQP